MEMTNPRLEFNGKQNKTPGIDNTIIAGLLQSNNILVINL